MTMIEIDPKRDVAAQLREHEASRAAYDLKSVLRMRTAGGKAELVDVLVQLKKADKATFDALAQAVDKARMNHGA
jgi:hypothetical protein